MQLQEEENKAKWEKLEFTEASEKATLVISFMRHNVTMESMF